MYLSAVSDVALIAIPMTWVSLGMCSSKKILSLGESAKVTLLLVSVEAMIKINTPAWPAAKACLWN